MKPIVFLLLPKDEFVVLYFCCELLLPDYVVKYYHHGEDVVFLMGDGRWEMSRVNGMFSR